MRVQFSFEDNEILNDVLSFGGEWKILLLKIFHFSLDSYLGAWINFALAGKKIVRL